MDSLTDPDVREGWLIKSAQIAWTSSLENILGYFVDQDPAPMMLIQPTVQAAEDFSKFRLDPMVRDTPRLAGRLAPSRDRGADSTILRKKFRGGQLVLAGANAPSGLAAHPIRVLLFDEVDRYPISAGVEGDPLAIATKRTQNFWNRKIFGGSTPTIKGASLIEAKYETGDQRRWYVPCPHCGEAQILRWAQVTWTDRDPSSARYACEKCGALWSDVERWSAIVDSEKNGGGFRPHAEFRGIRTWHLNAITSTFVKLEDMVREFLEAKGKPEKLKAFANLSLGETFEEVGATIEPGPLLERREPYVPDNVPAGVLLLTVGADVQDDRVELQLQGWGVDEECWILEQRVLRGDPGKPELWGEVDEYLKSSYATDDGRRLPIEAVAIDSGGSHTQAVYNFVVSRKRRRVWAIKGRGGFGLLAWPKKPSRAKKSRAHVFVLGVDTIKSVLYGRLGKVHEPGPGYVHLPASADDEFVRQLTSEKARTVYRKGRPTIVWEPRSEGIAQEAQDCWVYGYAAMLGRGNGSSDFLTRRARGLAAAPKAPAPRAIAKAPARDVEEEPTPHEPKAETAHPRPGRNAGWVRPRKGWFRR